MSGLFGQSYGFANGCVGGDAIEVLELKCSEAQSNLNFRVEACIGFGEQRTDYSVEPDLPAQGAHDQGGAEIAILRRKNRDAGTAKQIVGMGMTSLDFEKNRECFTAGRGDCRRFGSHG